MIRRSKWGSFLMLAALMVPSFCSCAKAEETTLPSAVSASSASVTAEPTADTAVYCSPTPTPLPKIDHKGHQAIKEYNALSSIKEGLTGVVRLSGGNLVASSVSDYIEGVYKEKNGRHINLYLIDPDRDEIIKTVTAQSPEEILLGTTEDGLLITHDGVAMKTYVYSADLELIRTLDNSGMDCFLDTVSDRLVYCSNGAVRTMTPDGREEVLLDKAFSTRLSGIDPVTKDLLVSDNDDVSACTDDHAIFSAADGRAVSMFVTDEYNALYFCGDSVLAVSKPDGYSCINVRDRGTGKETASWKIGNDVYIEASSFSDRCVMAYVTGPKDSYNVNTVIVADPVTGMYADTGIALNDVFAVHASYDRRTGHFFVIDSVREKDTKARLIEICPEAFTLDQELTKCEAPEYVKPDDEFKSGSHMAAARRHADELEKKYGVEIIIGNEIMNSDISTAYKEVSIEDYGMSADYQAEITESALKELDLALGRYPAEFFEWFRDYRGSSGLCFKLVGQLMNPAGSFMASAEAVTKGNKRFVLVDVNTISASTIHHELWHCVESLIEMYDPAAFAEDKWNALNPSGFKYSEDFEDYMSAGNDKWCKDNYIIDDKNDIYFARIYSTVNPMEDRATLCEQFVGNDNIYDAYHYKTALEDVCSCPHLKAKVEFLQQTCERIFGKSYW